MGLFKSIDLLPKLVNEQFVTKGYNRIETVTRPEPEKALTNQYSARVCYEHKVYAGELERGRTVEATAAFESGTVDDFAVCYFWCTRDGQPPAITAALPWSDLVETAIAR